MCDNCVKLGTGSFPLDEKFEIEIGKGDISEYGQILIFDYLRTLRADMGEDVASVALPFPPSDLEWKWVTKRGTLPKRLASYYHKTYSIKLQPEVLAQIGNLAAQHASKGAKYTIDFTQRFNWRSGDFGDNDSCYWGDRRGAREMMQDHESYAIRLYAREEDSNLDTGSGMGRAWFALDEYADNTAVLWNGYCNRYANVKLQTVDYACILATITGLSYRKISLYNEGEDSGTLYINSGVGYLIGEQEVIEDVDDYDFEWDDEYSHTRTCDNCGARVHEDELYSTPGYDMYCDECYNDNVTYCECCDRDVWRDEMNEVHGGRYDYVCDSCLRAHYTKCECYDKWYHDDKVTEVQNGDKVCPSCLEDNYSYCEHCNEYAPSEDFKRTHDGQWMCDDCGADYVECEHCTQLYPENETETVDGIELCESCAQEQREKTEAERAAEAERARLNDPRTYTEPLFPLP